MNVNITVAFSHNGDHYDGLSLADGVTFDLVDAPCGPARQMIALGNAVDAPAGIFFDSVSAIETSAYTDGYLFVDAVAV